MGSWRVCPDLGPLPSTLMGPPRERIGPLPSGFNSVPRTRLVALLVAGVVFGVVTSLVNHGFGPAAHSVSKVLGSGSAWLVAGWCASLTGHGWRGAFRNGLSFLLPAVTSYYIADAASGVYTSPSFDDPTGPVTFDLLSVVTDLGFYVVLALATSAVLGVVAALTQRAGLIGLLAAVAVPGFVAVTQLRLHQQLLALEFARDPAEISATWWTGMAALLATLAIVPARMLIDRRKNLWS